MPAEAISGCIMPAYSTASTTYHLRQFVASTSDTVAIEPYLRDSEPTHLPSRDAQK